MRPRTIAIGDVHGCALALEALLAAIRPRPDDVIVTLGDYVNRGPDSRGVLDRLIELERQCTPGPDPGESRQMLLAALAGAGRAGSRPTWLDMGGDATLASYGARRITEADLAAIPPEHLAFLRRCRDYHETDTHIFVHAQYDPDVAMDEQSAGCACAGSRSATASPARTSRARRAIVGHTSQKSGEVLDLDTWSASTPTATAAAG